MTSCPNCYEPQQHVVDDRTSPFCPKCRFPVRLLAGEYRLEKKLGSGGFGVVYLGRHIDNQEEYAIKLLRAEILEQLEEQLDEEAGEKKQREIVTRFMQEIRVTIDLAKDSPHIVQVFDVGQDDSLGHFYIMEYLRGDTLDRHLADGEALPLQNLLTIFEQLCQAVSTAHSHSIVHRDLKPSNIFLLPLGDGTFFVKVIDFGIAKSLLASNNITQTAGVLGSMMYLSPEQGRSEKVDQRTDIYALGGLFYRMLTGTPPFQVEGTTALLMAHLQRELEPMSMRRPDIGISSAMDAVITKAMAKEPNDRYDNVEAFWDAIQLASYTEAQANPEKFKMSSPQVTLVEGSPEMQRLWEAGKEQGLYGALPPSRSSSPSSTSITSTLLFQDEEPSDLFQESEALSFDDLPMEDEEHTVLILPGARLNPNNRSTSLEATIVHDESEFGADAGKSELFVDDPDNEEDEEWLDEIDYETGTSPTPLQPSDFFNKTQVASDEDRPNPSQTFATNAPKGRRPMDQTVMDSPELSAQANAFSSTMISPHGAIKESLFSSAPDNLRESDEAREFASLNAELEVSKRDAPPNKLPAPKPNFFPVAKKPMATPFTKTKMDEGNTTEALREAAKDYDLRAEAANAAAGESTYLNIPLPREQQLPTGQHIPHSAPRPHTLALPGLGNPAAAPAPSPAFDARQPPSTQHSLDVAALPPAENVIDNRRTIAHSIVDAPVKLPDIAPILAEAESQAHVPADHREVHPHDSLIRDEYGLQIIDDDDDDEDDKTINVSGNIAEFTGQKNAEAAPKKSKSPALWIGLGALLLACVGVGIYLMLPPQTTTPPLKRVATKKQAPTKRARQPKKVKPRPQPVFPAGKTRELPGLPKATVVWIPPGSFELGSPDDEIGRYPTEGPQTKVTLKRGFWMWRTEITQAQFQAVMGYNPAQFRKCGGQCPVESISWFQAAAFANKISAKYKLEPCYTCGTKKGSMHCTLRTKWSEAKGGKYSQCRGFRLPTEAEWEYAARAGTETALYTGTHAVRQEIKENRLREVAWYNNNSAVKYSGAFKCSTKNENRVCGTHQSGKKTPNAWGLYDMLGNVWEWVYDGFTPNYKGGNTTDPVVVGPKSRVGRGGSWNSAPRMIRNAYRGRLNPQKAYSSVGFRLVKTE